MAEMKKVPAIRFKGFSEVWEDKQIADLCSETTGGGTPKTTESKYWNGGIPWLQSSDLVENQLSNVVYRKTITEHGLKSSATKLVPADSIAIITRVGVGKLALISYEYSTSQDFLSLSYLKVDKWFGAYSIWKKIQSELHAVQGTSIKGITKEELLSKKTLIAKEKNEQTQIGGYFQHFDKLISLHQAKVDKLVNLKKAMLEKMFPKQGADMPEIRFKGFKGCWVQKKLGELMNVTSVKRIHQSDWTSAGVRFLRARDIVSAFKNEKIADYLYISKQKYDDYSLISGKVKKEICWLLEWGQLVFLF
ncbi:MAG: restriction endonuclease subunit S, partial [Nitrosomonas sp.]